MRNKKGENMKTRKGYKVYPLTSAQKLHFYCLKYCPKKQVLNIGSSLTIESDLDWDVLRQCIKEAIARCESMRLRFAKDRDGSIYQYVVKEETKEIEHFDFTGWQEEDADKKLREWTEIPFERYDSPMHRIVMIKTPDGYQGLYICVDHMTMDAQALIVFFKDVIELYCSRLYEEVNYPKEMSSYIKQLEKDLAYEAGSRDEDDISITTTIARRATLLEKRCGGSRIHCFPFRTIVPREDTFMEGLLKIRDAQNQYFRHAGYSPSEYFNFRHDYYKLKDGQTYEPLSLTYQPLAMKYDGPGLDKLGDIKYKTARYSNGVAAHTLYLTVSHRTMDNGLDFGFEYQTGVVTPEKLEYIYYYLCRIIFRGVEDPERTVGEIMEMV